MDSRSLFGLFAVTLMLVFYALEDCSPWFILAFAGACALGLILVSCKALGRLELLRRSGLAWPFGDGGRTARPFNSLQVCRMNWAWRISPTRARSPTISQSTMLEAETWCSYLLPES